jgi:hypothetical protein
VSNFLTENPIAFLIQRTSENFLSLFLPLVGRGWLANPLRGTYGPNGKLYFKRKYNRDLKFPDILRVLISYKNSRNYRFWIFNSWHFKCPNFETLKCLNFLEKFHGKFHLLFIRDRKHLKTFASLVLFPPVQRGLCLHIPGNPWPLFSLGKDKGWTSRNYQFHLLPFSFLKGRTKDKRRN